MKKPSFLTMRNKHISSISNDVKIHVRTLEVISSEQSSVKDQIQTYRDSVSMKNQGDNGIFSTTTPHCLGGGKLCLVSPPGPCREARVRVSDNPSSPIPAARKGLIDYKCFFFCRLIGWNVIPATTHNSPAVLLTDTGCDHLHPGVCL